MARDAETPTSLDEIAARQIAAHIVEIAAQLVQAPAATEIVMLEWAFARIGVIAGASIVAERELRDDGLLHYVAGWSRIDGLLDGEQPPLSIRGNLSDEPVCATKLSEMPVAPMQPSDMSPWEQIVGTAIPQSVFVPMITTDEPSGFLCLVADEGVVWGENILNAFTTVTALVAQFRSRVLAERSLQQQIAFNELQLSIGDRLLSVVTGEEDAALHSALAEIGRMLDVISLGVWETKAGRQAQLTIRWLKDGVERHSDPPFSVDIDDLPDELRAPDSARSTVLNPIAPDLIADYDDLEVQRELLAVRMSHTGGGVVLVGYTPGRRWKPWELLGLEAFANRIPILRNKLAVEEQLVASFHAAPVGITIRNDEGRLVDCNDAFVSFLGYESEMELLGSRPEDVLAEEWAIEEAEAIRDSDYDETTRPELPFQRKDGSIVWGRLSVRPLELGPKPMSLTHIEDITAERAKRLRLEERASTDELTGVANRHQMQATLSQLLNEQSPPSNATNAVAILLLDLDGFKEVNDLHGHSVGDRVLQEISSRIVHVSRDSDTVVRLGGDEFVVILPGPIHEEAASRAATRIRDAVAEPLEIDGRDIRLTVSIGSATSTDRTESVEHLLAEADRNMYAAKRALASGQLSADNGS